jgi:hypothetical protein
MYNTIYSAMFRYCTIIKIHIEQNGNLQESISRELKCNNALTGEFRIAQEVGT